MADRTAARVWLVDKPAGPTSHDVVRAVRRRFPRGVKVGHAGTLDPFATGLLVVLVGRATRLARYLVSCDKTYRARVVLGARSQSGDPEGPISPGGPIPDDQRVDQAVAALVGRGRQVVPALSAVKVDGERLYRRARRGETTIRPEREITVREARVVGRGRSDVRVELRVSSGTYVRQIAVDLGEQLGCGAYCAELRRTAVGHLDLRDAVAPATVAPTGGGLEPAAALAHLPSLSLDAAQAERVGHGGALPGEIDGPVVLMHAGHTVAVARGDGAELQPEVVLR